MTSISLFGSIVKEVELLSSVTAVVFATKVLKGEMFTVRFVRTKKERFVLTFFTEHWCSGIRYIFPIWVNTPELVGRDKRTIYGRNNSYCDRGICIGGYPGTPVNGAKASFQEQLVDLEIFLYTL